jgi:predicted nucleic acid-binding protein
MKETREYERVVKRTSSIKIEELKELIAQHCTNSDLVLSELSEHLLVKTIVKKQQVVERKIKLQSNKKSDTYFIEVKIDGKQTCLSAKTIEEAREIRDKYHPVALVTKTRRVERYISDWDTVFRIKIQINKKPVSAVAKTIEEARKVKAALLQRKEREEALL